MKSILVVGGAGYVGSVLTRQLLDDGYRVRVMDALLYDNGATVRPLLENDNFEFMKGDLRDGTDTRRALEGMDVVVLAAALVGDPICRAHPELCESTNREGSIRFLEASERAGVRQVIFFSTCSNYGLRDDRTLLDEEAALEPRSLYAETKVDVERFLISGSLNTDYTILRLATVFGVSPRMRLDLTVNDFAYTLAATGELLVYDADTWRPYCHVSDVSRAVRLVIGNPDRARNTVFNVGGVNYTKRMIAKLAQQYAGGEVTYRDGMVDPRNYRVDFTRIKKVLGFEPEKDVPKTVDRVVHAVRQGLFADIEARGKFHRNEL